MPYWTADRFCKRYGGVLMLIKFLEMSNDPKIPNKDIAKEFNMSEGNVTHYQYKLGSFFYKPVQDVLDYIVNKAETEVTLSQKKKDFVAEQQSKVIRHDFRQAIKNQS